MIATNNPYHYIYICTYIHIVHLFNHYLYSSLVSTYVNLQNGDGYTFHTGVYKMWYLKDMMLNCGSIRVCVQVAVSYSNFFLLPIYGMYTSILE